MEIDWIKYVTMVLDAFVPLALTAIAYLITVWLKKSKLSEETKEAIMDAWELLEKCVLKIQQTTVESLKKNGNFDEAAQAEAKQQCIAAFGELVNDAMVMAIEKTYGSIDSWLDTAIEATVQEIKITKAA